MLAYVDAKEKAFLEKLAGKIGRPTPEIAPSRSVIGPPDFWGKNRPSQDELLQQFVTYAEKLTAKVQVITEPSQIQIQIGEWLTEIKARSVLCWDSEDLKQIGIQDACRALGYDTAVWDLQANRLEMIRKCASVDVGITWADYGIANTGSLAIISSPVQSRSVSLLPPVHIAILKKENILPHMGDIFAKLDEASLPSSLNFITGPSRTSDIEMDLALGVHGPGRVFILILNQ